ncbi:hypothetical protein UUU_45170 [Klebsiella pneumoniae subsp. pneumoniae DSM 30104 = JCM 1662 = NBRC 14940]|nr:hypothetical protein UUU_45170 [Klebsiella pneumoniae subsp. pneumoniae DSM 30104 = JCM 1662 = NBRC 14940]
MTAHPAQGFLHIKSVPQYHCVSDQAQCTKLIFLPFTIALSDLPTLTITDAPVYSFCILLRRPVAP